MHIFMYDRYNDHFSRWLRGLIEYFKRNGHTVEIAYRTRLNFKRIVGRSDHCFVWGGALPCYKRVRAACRRCDVPLTIIEVGWFPQSRYYHVDDRGINAGSSLMDDDLDWVTDEHLRQLDSFALNYLNGRTWQASNEYILCPLQLEHDTNIVAHSPFRTMQDFIDKVEVEWPARKVLFKAHPLKRRSTYRTREPMVTSGSFLDMAQHAERVIGINSTCLLEAVMMGVPVTSMGEGLLKRHAGNERRLLAALVNRQIPVESSDLDAWIEPVLARRGYDSKLDPRTMGPVRLTAEDHVACLT